MKMRSPNLSGPAIDRSDPALRRATAAVNDASCRLRASHWLWALAFMLGAIAGSLLTKLASS